MLQSDESICRLHGKTVLIQSRKAFCATTDSVLLADFCRVRAGDRCLDLGSGQGILAVSLLSRYEPKSVTALECDTILCERLQRTAEQNGTDNLRVVQGDLRNIEALFRPGSFDFAAANPPYFPPDAGAVAPDAARRTARAETDCTLAQLCAAAARALTWGGSFCLVHRPDRLADVLEELRRVRLEPKRLRFVHHTAAARPSLFLLEARLGGGVGLTVEPPLLLHGPDGGETEDVRRAYFRDKEE